jgi:hypothetical protein
MDVYTSGYDLILFVSSVDAMQHFSEFVTKEAPTAIHEDSDVALWCSFILSSASEFRRPKSHLMGNIVDKLKSNAGKTHS